MRARSMFITKDQAEAILSRRNFSEMPALPKKGEMLYIAHAITGEPFQVDVEVIELTNRKSDEGKRLYSLTQSSKAGRAFDETVCEAHVVDYYNVLSERLRASNLQKLEALDLAARCEEDVRSSMARSCAA